MQLPDSVVEHDIRGLVLSVDSHIDELIFEGADCARADGIRSSKAGTTTRVWTHRRPAYAEPPDVEGRMGGFVKAPSSVEEPDHATAGSTPPLLGMQKEAMPEMLRVNDFLKG